jgi:hypothetical protein
VEANDKRTMSKKKNLPWGENPANITYQPFTVKNKESVSIYTNE